MLSQDAAHAHPMYTLGNVAQPKTSKKEIMNNQQENKRKTASTARACHDWALGQACTTKGSVRHQELGQPDVEQ
jgi:hypothetical protein